MLHWNLSNPTEGFVFTIGYYNTQKKVLIFFAFKYFGCCFVVQNLWILLLHFRKWKLCLVGFNKQWNMYSLSVEFGVYTKSMVKEVYGSNWFLISSLCLTFPEIWYLLLALASLNLHFLSLAKEKKRKGRGIRKEFCNSHVS